MKKTIIALVCGLVAPLAFAQTSTTTTEETTTSTRPSTTTETTTSTTYEMGTVTTYEPGKTIVAMLSALVLIESARISPLELERKLAVTVARQLVMQASSRVGTNLNYQIGDGAVMF